MENILLGFFEVFQPINLLGIMGGVLIGVIVGSLPGLNDSITLAVLIPVTFGMDAKFAMCLLVGIYVAACYGGSIPAILLKIPGTASSVVTAIDGYEMTKKGQAGLALSISTTSSVIGGIISSLVLLFFSPILAEQALKFGPPEYFMLAIMGLCTVIGMARGSMLKNIVVMAFGLALSCIGLSPQTGFQRLTFDNPYLLEGIPLVPMLIGLFGATSVLELVESKKGIHNITEKVERVRVKPLSKEMYRQLLPTWAQSGIIGTIIGVIPGAGMIMAIYLAYDQAVRRNKKLAFGTGVPEGVASAETANNAVVASSMVPLLALGVPGNSTSALFLGALTIQGLRPGPRLYADFPDVAYLLVVAFLVANILMFPIGLAFCNFLAGKILRIKREYLSGIILILCVSGAYAVSNSIFNIWIVIIFSIIGFLMNKFQLPQSPLILAMVLGSMMEKNFLQSMILSENSWSIFITRPVSLVLVVISVLFVVSPLIKTFKEKERVKQCQK